MQNGSFIYTSPMRYLYSLIFYLALPFIFVRLWWRSWKNPAYKKRWRERLGYTNFSVTTPSLWIHAVSLGEAIAATPLIKALLQDYSETKLIVTTMTVTGSEHIQKTFGKQIFHSYIPYDFPGALKRFLQHAQPKLLIIMETELWPNLLYYCKQRNIPTLIANARLSERSARGYQYIRFFIRPMLQNITMIAAQSKADAQRFIALGANSDSVSIVGNIKFDLNITENIITQGKELRQRLGAARPVWIAASTHQGEDEIILQAFAEIQKILPQTLLILVPRHPERFDRVAALCQQQGFILARRSEPLTSLNNTDIFLGDTIGDLILFYAAADVAFVGGSLVPQGGHNLLEPAILQLPIITGPYLFNFTQIAQLLQQVDALIPVQTASELAKAVLQLLQNPQLKQQTGQRAQQVVKQNQGALKQHLKLIAGILSKKN